MNDVIVTFRSVTFAQWGEGVLHRAGIGCTLTRTPKHLEQKGCGYSLRLHAQDRQRAQALLDEEGVPYRKVYQAAGGTLRAL